VDKVVRVVASQRKYDHDAPWNVKTDGVTTAAGVIIGPSRILTTADVAGGATALHVHAANGERAAARVVAIDYDRDLALVELETRGELFAEIEPSELGSLPTVGTDLDTLTLDDDGSDFAYLYATVAKHEAQRYALSQRYLPVVVIDVGIGNHHRGGPAFRDDKLVGLCHQKPTQTENVCELIPTPVIAAFLHGAKRGPVVAVPSLGFATQNLQNPYLRADLGVERGVVITEVSYGEAADGVLRRGDVVVGVGGHPVQSGGTIQLFGEQVGGWLRYDAICALHHPGDRLRIDYVRERQQHRVDLVLAPWQPLVPRSSKGLPPKYVVYAGLVFQALSRDYLKTWDEWWNHAPKEFLHAYYLGRRTPSQHEVVILASVLGDDATVGYEHLHNEAVATIDGHPPLDLADFAGRLARARGTVRIETTSGGIIVLDTDEAQRATARVLAAYSIPADRTPGLPS